MSTTNEQTESTTDQESNNVIDPNEGNDDNEMPNDVPRVRVKKWNAVAYWSYDIENDTCAM